MSMTPGAEDSRGGPCPPVSRGFTRQLAPAEGGGDDRLGPVGCRLQCRQIVAARMEDAAVPHLEDEEREGHVVARRGLGAVVEDLQMREARQERDQVLPRAVPALADLRLRNVVAAMAGA